MRTCDDLGVCNGRHCTDVSACPDYDLIACNSGNCPEHDARPMPCPHQVCRPTHPFAPGTIQGPRLPIVYLDDDGSPWLPLSLGETLKLLAVMLALGALAGYLVERFA